MLNDRINKMKIIQFHHQKNMNYYNKKIDFANFFKDNEKVLSYEYSTPFKHFFRGYTYHNNEKFKYILKVIPYAKLSGPKDCLDYPERPENSEIIIHNLLFNFLISVKIPFIVFPYISYNTDIYPFVDPAMKNIVNDNNKYIEFINRYNDGRFYDEVKLLFLEYSIDLKKYLLENKNNLILNDWKVMLFQILITLTVIQEKYPSFKHNNLSLNSIWVSEYDKEQKVNIMFNKKKYKFNTNKNFLISNFSLSTIENLINNTRLNNNFINQMGINKTRNRYYDIHYFFINIFSFCHNNKIDLPDEIKDFFDRNIPQKYQLVTDKYIRTIVDEEIITPKEIIENDSLFYEFRIIKKFNITKNEVIII